MIFNGFPDLFLKIPVFLEKIRIFVKRCVRVEWATSFLFFWLWRSQGVIFTQLDDFCWVIIWHMPLKRWEWIPNRANEEFHRFPDFFLKKLNFWTKMLKGCFRVEGLHLSYFFDPGGPRGWFCHNSTTSNGLLSGIRPPKSGNRHRQKGKKIRTYFDIISDIAMRVKKIIVRIGKNGQKFGPGPTSPLVFRLRRSKVLILVELDELKPVKIRYMPEKSRKWAPNWANEEFPGFSGIFL